MSDFLTLVLIGIVFAWVGILISRHIRNRKNDNDS